MTTQEHLNKILEKCRAFLEIAEKRTPGEWKSDPQFKNEIWCDAEYICDCIDKPESNATFIAACAGPAEAMARSTIAAVTDILEYWDLHKDTELVVAVLAAWPEETL